MQLSQHFRSLKSPSQANPYHLSSQAEVEEYEGLLKKRQALNDEIRKLLLKKDQIASLNNMLLSKIKQYGGSVQGLNGVTQQAGQSQQREIIINRHMTPTLPKQSISSAAVQPIVISSGSSTGGLGAVGRASGQRVVITSGSGANNTPAVLPISGASTTLTRTENYSSVPATTPSVASPSQYQHSSHPSRSGTIIIHSSRSTTPTIPARMSEY